jgi:hypothetical protein
MEKQKCMKLLVAAPQHECKEYAFRFWIDAVNNIIVPHDTLVVDNSPSIMFSVKWGTEVPMVWENCGSDKPYRRITKSMELIRGYFLSSEYTHWLNIETDVIVPPDIATFMLAHSEGVDWLNFPYPYRNRQITTGFGCALFSRRIMEHESFSCAPDDYAPDAWFWDKVYQKHSVSWIRDSSLKLEHLSNAR